MEFLYSVFVLFVLPFGVASFILFYVMKAAVKSAIDDLQIKSKNDIKTVNEKEDSDRLIELRDMEILNDTELENAISSYKGVRTNKEINEQFLKYTKILSELKGIGHFNEDEYIDKSNMLKKHFNID